VSARRKKVRHYGGCGSQQPDGEKRVRVWMEAASFDDVMRWLVLLDTRYGVRIENSVFEMKQESGRVDARLVFEAST